MRLDWSRFFFCSQYTHTHTYIYISVRWNILLPLHLLTLSLSPSTLATFFSACQNLPVIYSLWTRRRCWFGGWGEEEFFPLFHTADSAQYIYRTMYIVIVWYFLILSWYFPFPVCKEGEFSFVVSVNNSCRFSLVDARHLAWKYDRNKLWKFDLKYEYFNSSFFKR